MARRADVRYIHYYTEGSAAYKLEPVQVRKPQPARRPVKQKRITVFVDPLAIAGIAVAVVMLILMLVGVGKLQEAQRQTAAMERYVETLSQEKQTLQATYEDGYNLEDIKWMADALGMVPVEEVRHITIQPAQVQIQEVPSAWERFCTYLTSLFA